MATAFSNALRVRIERAVTSPRMSAKSALTLARTSANLTGLISFCSVTAAGEQVIGTHMPSASMTVAIVHAVNIAEHVPEPGSEWHSSLYSSSSSIKPAPYAPMPSITEPGSSCLPLERPLSVAHLPGSAGPPKSVSPTMSSRASGISAAGTDLSHPARQIIASAA